MRWVLCWNGRATVNRFVAGSIPASAAPKAHVRVGKAPSLEIVEDGSNPLRNQRTAKLYHGSMSDNTRSIHGRLPRDTCGLRS